ncbi:hypothetical protein UPYG_G00274420 [Umbra pygmaea]|uniref:Stimulated by retinoic acid protein 8 n=1 Tax=Umbra pygmaea TaxID=75934 RepID=A0A172MFI1_UMBPY|nr:stimulated by retinoic acid protein 8 [Umbra pygmaea]
MFGSGCAGSCGLRRKRDIQQRQKERRRALQARHRANIATLFQTLQDVVCPTSNKMPAKWKILDHAKGFLRAQEAYLSRLLLVKGIFLSNDDGPCSLDEVRDEYRRLHSHTSTSRSRRPVHQIRRSVADIEDLIETSEEDFLEEGLDDFAPSQNSVNSPPNIQEFEGYMLFYRQTVDQLVCSGVLSPAQTGLEVVSEAISGLWDSFAPERRAAYLTCSQQSAPGWTGGRDSDSFLSLQPSNSLKDSPAAAAYSPLRCKEDLFQDAYEVVKMDCTSEHSSDQPPYSDVENVSEIYSNIMLFVKSQMTETTAHPQDLTAMTYYDVFLQCSESFDSDEL